MWQIRLRCLPTPYGVDRLNDHLRCRLHPGGLCPLCLIAQGDEHHILNRCSCVDTDRNCALDNFFAEMEDIIGKSAAATLVARKADLDEPVMAEKVAAFALVLERHAGSG